MISRLGVRINFVASTAFVCLMLALASTSAHAVDVKLIYLDAPGQGVYDTTSCAPACDNSGKTLGEQRRVALQYAASFIGARLVSAVPIRITVDFQAVYCAPANAVLATAGTASLVSEFAGAPRSNTLYPIALANALAGRRLVPGSDDVVARFNSALDKADACLGGGDWYYGLDRKTPDGDINFVSTVIHEVIHGLGFQSYVILRSYSPNGDVGQFPTTGAGRMPDVFSRHIRDLSMPGQPLWPELTAAQRAKSATHGPYLVWDGNSTNSVASAILDRGIRQGRVQLYAPSTVEVGSSVSHWASVVQPDQLMEPFITAQPIFNLGLAACALQDMGWTLSSVANGCAASGGAAGDTSTDSSTEDANSAAPENSGSGTKDAADHGARGSGGCTVNPDAAFDPALPLLVLMALAVLGWRRRRCPAA